VTGEMFGDELASESCGSPDHDIVVVCCR